MHSKILLITLCVLVLGITTGCSRVRTYTMDKERVDQDLPDGASALYPDRSATRKVVVVEFVEKEQKNAPVITTKSEEETISVTGESKVVTKKLDTVVVHESNFTFPKMTSEMLTQKSPTEETSLPPATYKVEKDDTLQKIAKKFYGSYAQWTKIYDANKDVIHNPNVLKPGITLKIPVLENPAGKDPVVTPAEFK